MSDTRSRARIMIAALALSAAMVIAPAAVASAATYGTITMYNNCGAKASFTIKNQYNEFQSGGAIYNGARITTTVRTGLTYYITTGVGPARSVKILEIPGRTHAVTFNVCF